MIHLRVIISAGGTGGHIYPALAIAKKIKQKELELRKSNLALDEYYMKYDKEG